jgi:hypothetical protein
VTTDADAGDYYEIFDPSAPEFTAEWLYGISWADYQPKAIDSGTPGTPMEYGFGVE